jgi:hypothetical protein
MKRCTRCDRTYPDDNLNFCLDDGELLVLYAGDDATKSLRDDAPPTVVLDQTRVTNPVSWPSPSMGQPPQQSQPPMQQTWQPPQQQAQYQPNYAFAPHPMMMRGTMGASQVLPIVSLSLGIASIVIGWCCSIGVLLAPAAIITGAIGLFQIKTNPGAYSGKGLAIAGIATGSLYIVGVIIFVMLYGAAILMGGLAGN